MENNLSTNSKKIIGIYSNYIIALLKSPKLKLLTTNIYSAADAYVSLIYTIEILVSYSALNEHEKKDILSTLIPLIGTGIIVEFGFSRDEFSNIMEKRDEYFKKFVVGIVEDEENLASCVNSITKEMALILTYDITYKSYVDFNEESPLIIDDYNKEVEINLAIKEWHRSTIKLIDELLKIFEHELDDRSAALIINNSFCTTYAAINNIPIEAAKAIIKSKKNLEDTPKSNHSPQISKSYTKELVIICVAIVLIIISIVTFAKTTLEESDTSTSEIHTSTTSTTTATTTNKYPALILPDSGDIIISTDRPRNSKITIHNSSSNCFVKLKDNNLNDVFGFFVRSGADVTVDVPQGDFYVYFAYGDTWYGKNHLFGDNTQCSKDRTLLNFTDYSYEYTLYNVNYGNFNPEYIDTNEF